MKMATARKTKPPGKASRLAEEVRGEPPPPPAKQFQTLPQFIPGEGAEVISIYGFGEKAESGRRIIRNMTKALASGASPASEDESARLKAWMEAATPVAYTRNVKVDRKLVVHSTDDGTEYHHRVDTVGLPGGTEPADHSVFWLPDWFYSKSRYSEERSALRSAGLLRVARSKHARKRHGRAEESAGLYAKSPIYRRPPDVMHLFNFPTFQVDEGIYPTDEDDKAELARSLSVHEDRADALVEHEKHYEFFLRARMLNPDLLQRRLYQEDFGAPFIRFGRSWYIETLTEAMQQVANDDDWFTNPFSGDFETSQPPDQPVKGRAGQDPAPTKPVSPAVDAMAAKAELYSILEQLEDRKESIAANRKVNQQVKVGLNSMNQRLIHSNTTDAELKRAWRKNERSINPLVPDQGGTTVLERLAILKAKRAAMLRSLEVERVPSGTVSPDALFDSFTFDNPYDLLRINGLRKTLDRVEQYYRLQHKLATRPMKGIDSMPDGVFRAFDRTPYELSAYKPSYKFREWSKGKFPELSGSEYWYNKWLSSFTETPTRERWVRKETEAITTIRPPSSIAISKDPEASRAAVHELLQRKAKELLLSGTPASELNEAMDQFMDSTFIELTDGDEGSFQLTLIPRDDEPKLRTEQFIRPKLWVPSESMSFVLSREGHVRKWTLTDRLRAKTTSFLSDVKDLTRVLVLGVPQMPYQRSNK